MPKSKQQKVTTVSSLVKGLKDGKAAVFANFQGLTVADSESLRRECRAQGVDVLVVKKTLVKRACDEAGFENVNPTSFTGGIATFISKTDEVSPAKIVSNFAKTHEVVTVFGGILEGKFLNKEEVEALSKLPSKTELYGRLVGSLNAPISGFVNVMAGNLRGLVTVLKAIGDKK